MFEAIAESRKVDVSAFTNLEEFLAVDSWKLL
jgi:hypothetical protein